jgi:hypothetical protein
VAETVHAMSCMPPDSPKQPFRDVVFGFTHKSHHCVFCTVIRSCVLCGHRTQLQGELVLGRVSGDAAFEGLV